MKKILAIMLILVMAFSMTAALAENPTIKLGYVENITGTSATTAILCKRGVDIAHELNPTVVIDGVTYDIEVVVVDSKSDAVEASNAASRAIEQEKVVALIGPSNSRTNLAMGDVVKEGEIPCIAPSATNALVTFDNPWYFRACFTNEFHATVMANFAYEQGWKKCAIFQDISSEASVDTATLFKNIFSGLVNDPNAVVFTQGYNSTDSDYNAQLVNLKQYEFDFIFSPNGSQTSGMVINQAVDMGIDTVWLGIDSWEVPIFIEVGGENLVNKVFFSSFFDTSVAQTPTTEVLLAKHEELYPGVECAAHTALCFDSYNVMVKAIENAQSTEPAAIRDALEAMQDFPGATGYIEFDENHNVENLAVVKTVSPELQFSYVSTVKPGQN